MLTYVLMPSSNAHLRPNALLCNPHLFALKKLLFGCVDTTFAAFDLPGKPVRPGQPHGLPMSARPGKPVRPGQPHGLPMSARRSGMTY